MQKKFEVGDRVYLEHFNSPHDDREWNKLEGTLCRYRNGEDLIIALDHDFGYKCDYKKRTDKTESIWFVDKDEVSTWKHIDQTVKGDVKYAVNHVVNGGLEKALNRRIKNSKLARKMYPNNKITECGEWIYV